MFEEYTKGKSIYIPLEEQNESEMDKDSLRNGEKLRPRHPLGEVGASLAILTFFAAYSCLLIWGTGKVDRMDRRHGTRWLKCEFLIMLMAKSSFKILTRLSQAPVNNYISYEPREFEQEERTQRTQYFQKPSPKVDQNWHNLFERKRFRILDGWERSVMLIMSDRSEYPPRARNNARPRPNGRGD
ncbi:hypothetical protein MMC14_003838 [Varicellaria rhodocarpa]|nr:hypothetical protein [Varicellaria rhodocarpa]